MITEVEILTVIIPETIETGLIITLAEKTETGLMEVIVGIDFILEIMTAEMKTGIVITETPVEIGTLAEKV